MKEIKLQKSKNLFKKLFIKLCRFMGYEIIDQSNFYVPTSDKNLNQTLSKSGKKSINLPLGEVKISRKIKSLDVMIRTCSSVNMLTQSKKRIFEKDKIEYTLRSINSILRSVNYAKNYHPNISIKITIIDHKSSSENLKKIKDLLNSTDTKFNLLNLDISEFEGRIKKMNEKNEETTFNQISNMSNIYKSLTLSKTSEDLIYFVEDDYVHELNSITEMLITHWRDVVRHMRNLSALKVVVTTKSVAVRGPRQPMLRPSASESFALRKPPDWDQFRSSMRRLERSISPTPTRRKSS